MHAVNLFVNDLSKSNWSEYRIVCEVFYALSSLQEGKVVELFDFKAKCKFRGIFFFVVDVAVWNKVFLYLVYCKVDPGYKGIGRSCFL